MNSQPVSARAAWDGLAGQPAPGGCATKAACAAWDEGTGWRVNPRLEAAPRRPPARPGTKTRLIGKLHYPPARLSLRGLGRAGGSTRAWRLRHEGRLRGLGRRDGLAGQPAPGGCATKAACAAWDEDPFDWQIALPASPSQPARPGTG